MFDSISVGNKSRFRKLTSVWTWTLIFSFLAAIVLLPVVITKIAGSTPFGQQLSGYSLSVESPPEVAATIGDVVELKASLTAIAGKDVRIVGAKVPCGCIDISPIPMSIPSGTSKEIVMRFDTSERSARVFKGEIPLLLDIKSPPVSIRFQLDLKAKQ